MSAPEPFRRCRRTRAAAALAVASALLAGAAPARANGVAATPASAGPAVHDRVDLGPRTLDLSIDVAPPASGLAAVSGEARVETELALGASLVLRQPYTVSLAGDRMLGASRIEARRALQLGAGTVATLDLAAEPLVRGLSPRAQTRLEHRFTQTSRAELALGVDARDPAAAAAHAPAVSGTLRFEHRF